MYFSLYKIYALLFLVCCVYISESKAFFSLSDDMSRLKFEIKDDRTAHLTGYFLLTDIQELLVKKAPELDLSKLSKEEVYKEDIQNLLTSKIFIFINRTRFPFTQNEIKLEKGKNVFINFKIDTLPEVVKDFQIDLASLHSEYNSSYFFTFSSSALQDSVSLNRDNFYTHIFAVPHKKEINLNFGRLYLVGGIILIWVIFIFWLIYDRKEDDYDFF